MHLYLFILPLALVSSITSAAPVDLPTRSAKENQIPQDPPVVQVVKILNNFLSTLSSRNYTQAYQAFGSRRFKETVSPEQFRNFAISFPALGRNRSVVDYKVVYYDKSVGEPAVPGDTAVVDAVLESFEGQRNIGSFVLIFEAGQWRIWKIEVLPAPLMKE